MLVVRAKGRQAPPAKARHPLSCSRNILCSSCLVLSASHANTPRMTPSTFRWHTWKERVFTVRLLCPLLKAYIAEQKKYRLRCPRVQEKIAIVPFMHIISHNLKLGNVKESSCSGCQTSFWPKKLVACPTRALKPICTIKHRTHTMPT